MENKAQRLNGWADWASLLEASFVGLVDPSDQPGSNNTHVDAQDTGHEERYWAISWEKKRKRTLKGPSTKVKKRKVTEQLVSWFTWIKDDNQVACIILDFGMTRWWMKARLNALRCSRSGLIISLSAGRWLKKKYWEKQKQKKKERRVQVTTTSFHVDW